MEDPYIGKRNDKDNKGGAKIRQKKNFYDIYIYRNDTSKYNDNKIFHSNKQIGITICTKLTTLRNSSHRRDGDIRRSRPPALKQSLKQLKTGVAT